MVRKRHDQDGNHGLGPYAGICWSRAAEGLARAATVSCENTPGGGFQLLPASLCRLQHDLRNTQSPPTNRQTTIVFRARHRQSPGHFSRYTVYPTAGGAIAIGLEIQADPPGQFFDTKGTVWLKARPRIDAVNFKLIADDIDYGSEADNAATNLLVSIARLPFVRQNVQQAVAYDYSKEYAKALAAANTALNREVASGIVLESTISEATFDDIQASDNGIYLGLKVVGTARLRTSSATANE